MNKALNKLDRECGSDPNIVVNVTWAQVKRADEIERANELVKAAAQVTPVSPDSIGKGVESVITSEVEDSDALSSLESTKMKISRELQPHPI